MTTIAVDHLKIAADGQSLSNGERIANDRKKITVRPATGTRPARIFALTGARVMTAALIDWYEEGHNPATMPSAKSADFTLIVIEADAAGVPRLSIVNSDVPYPGEMPLPQAFGTGGSYAQGVLGHGGTAREAVEVAIKLDIHSGGDIQEVDIAVALGLQPPAKTNGLGTVPHKRDDFGAPATL